MGNIHAESKKRNANIFSYYKIIYKKTRKLELQ